MSNVKGLYFVTPEKHPNTPIYKKPHRRFYIVDEWEEMSKRLLTHSKGQDFLLARVVSTHGEAMEETKGFFLIHKHPKKWHKRRYYGTDNLDDARGEADRYSVDRKQCFLVAQVIAEISAPSKKKKNNWMCGYCGQRNKPSYLTCKACGKEKTLPRLT